MLIKRTIKGIILFILLLVLVIIGIRMYRQIRDNRQNYNTDIYNCLPEHASQVINIGRNYHLEDVFYYDSAFSFLPRLIKQLSFPILIAKVDNDYLLLSRITNNQYESINDIFKEDISTASPKVLTYNGTDILFYPMPHQEFVTCSMWKGIFILGTDYKMVETFMAKNNSEPFFYGYDSQILSHIASNSPISLYIKNDKDLLAMDYAFRNDSLFLNGYILGNRVNTNRYQNDSLTIFNNKFRTNIKTDSLGNDIVISALLNKK